MSAPMWYHELPCGTHRPTMDAQTPSQRYSRPVSHSGALDKEPGPILVTGHTDNIKPRPTSAFKSNYDLSVARAKSVEAVLAKSLSDPTRIQADGKGDLDPVADNKTEQGRAQNRRVEIMIPKEETLQPQAGANG